MKITKKSQQLAKQIFLASQKSGKTNEAKLRKFITLLVRNRSSNSKEILGALEKFLIREQKNSELILESAYPIESREKNAIKVFFEKKLGKKMILKELENKNLISGIKVSQADNVWENTVLSNLQILKGNN